MSRSVLRSFHATPARLTKPLTPLSQPPIIRIKNATFYREHPASVPDAGSKHALFPKLSFELPSSLVDTPCWAIIGPSNCGKSTFLEILRGQHICLPPNARSYPSLENDPRNRLHCQAFKCVGFDHGERGLSGPNTAGAYLSARFESRREATDFTLLNYLRGHTELNAAEAHDRIDDVYLDKITRDLNLRALLELPVGNLSNGQMRRATIARALLDRPDVLLLDEPFAGLDPRTVQSLPTLLSRLIRFDSLRLIITLRPQDPIPRFISHLLLLGPQMKILYNGTKDHGLEKISRGAWKAIAGMPIKKPSKRNGRFSVEVQADCQAPLIEMKGVTIKYGDRTVLGGWRTRSKEHGPRSGLWWTLRRGERWGIFGPNGSGKTTILALICSDHPQSYSLPIEFFGKSRLPTHGQPGISIFDIQSRIGHSSPEIHNFFPRGLSVRQTIENAWADTFRSKPILSSERDQIVDECLLWFEPELNPACTPPLPNQTRTPNDLDGLPPDLDWADQLPFSDTPYSSQKVLLLLRALVKRPDLVILDEAFSGMDDRLREKCMSYLEHGVTRPSNPERLTPARRRPPMTKRTRGAKSAPLPNSRPVAELHFKGLEPHQALICISHVKEEVPNLVRKWMCLPDANSGQRARTGDLKGPLAGDEQSWRTIWGLKKAQEAGKAAVGSDT